MSDITNHEVRQTIDVLIIKRDELKKLLVGKTCKCPKKTAMGFDDRNCPVCRLSDIEILIERGNDLLSSGRLNDVGSECQNLVEDAILYVFSDGHQNEDMQLATM